MHTTPQRDPRWKRRAQAGFSLIELLMTMLIIGVIGSLAMMSLGSGMSNEAEEQRDKRNAQTIANVAAMASAAGAEYFVAGDEDATVENLREGCTPDSGIFKNRMFKLPGLEETHIQKAQRFLRLNSTDLIYDSRGDG